MADLCLTLTSPRMKRLQADIQRYAGRMSLIEIRLDALDKPRLPVLPPSSTRFIATCRPKREGGHYQGDETARLDLLAQASRQGFSWIDLEHDVKEFPDLPPEVGLIRSLHAFREFDSSPAWLDHQLARLKGRGQILKLAVSIFSTSQLVRLLEWMEQLPPNLERVVLGMGDLGTPSRFLGAFLGNRWTYVYPQESTAAAPGQFSFEEATQTYFLDRLGPCPKLYGLMGNPVAHSLSPLLHNALFHQTGLPGLYIPLRLDDPDSWLDYIARSRLPFAGFSVTIPFKTQVARHDWSRESGLDAVNTLAKTSQGWAASNTDFDGFLRPLLRRSAFPLDEALVLGSGGAARSAIRALMTQGSNVTCVSRDRTRADRLAAQLGCRATTYDSLPASADLCVNATPVGQWPHEDATPIQPSEVEGLRLVYDLIYRPERTRLLGLADECGMETVSGIEMFIEQAALQFLKWTDIDPDRQEIAQILEDIESGLHRRISPSAEKIP